MKPSPLSYVAASSLEDVFDLFDEYNGEAALLAGGQSLMPILNFRIGAPPVLVDINAIPGLDRIELVDGQLHIGALARQSDILVSAVVAEYFPVLAEAVRAIGHTPIRNRGTVGGSLAHADPAAEIPACVAAVSGRIRLRSKRGERLIPFADFVLGPMMTTKSSDEIITGVVLPSLADYSYGFHEITRRCGDFALAGAVAVLRGSDGRIDHANIGSFGVGPVPSRLGDLEEALVGATLDGALEIAALGEFELPVADEGRGNAGYSAHLARVAVATALAAAVVRERGKA